MSDSWHVTKRSRPYPRGTDGRIQVDLWGHPARDCEAVGCANAVPEYVANEVEADAPPAGVLFNVESGEWRKLNILE